MGIVERKEREKQQRREDIVLAAEKVFFSRGFERSTMDDIADEAELSKGTLYLYFRSKEDLHLAVAHRAVSMLSSFMEEMEDPGEHALQKLERMGRATIDFYLRFPNHMRSIMFLEGIGARQISVSAEQVREVIFKESPVGMVIDVVEQGVKEKLIRDDIPPAVIGHTLWMQMLSVMRFVTMKSLIFEMLDLTPEEIYESHFKLVLSGITS